MTNNALLSAWDDYLKKAYNCHPDCNGNRPCDNGMLCDRCHDEAGQAFVASLMKGGE